MRSHSMTNSFFYLFCKKEKKNLESTYLRIGVLETKFKNWCFGNLIKIGVLKIKFKNWNFGN